MELNISIQKELTSSSMMMTSNNASFQSHHAASTSKVTGTGRESIRSPAATYNSGSASPIIENHSKPFVGADMVDLIKSRMEMRLRNMLTS